METATLTSPPRPVMVQPVQKSLSLPSYARASGEGIDHKLIFAALEQREKVRRKSRIFKEKEKTGTTRQNYFCLPLPSSAKCKETSLSSDTSCSSLEFQKPKYRNSPRNVRRDLSQSQNGVKDNEPSVPSLAPTAKIDVNNNSDEGNHAPVLKMIDKERILRTSRSTIGSSDSMEKTERSSRSSNDSLSRRERLVAMKARVEAERERKLCNSTSEEEEETSLRITRHNSDGVIHRTVREVKSKSSRSDKRVRRKAPEESAARRAARKQHRSLYIPSTVDLDSWKPPIVRSGSSFSLQRDLDVMTDYFFGKESIPKDSFTPTITNHSYFSDICSGDYTSRFVKPIVDKIESNKFLNKDNTSRSKVAQSSRNGGLAVDGQLLDPLPNVEYATKKLFLGSGNVNESSKVSQMRAPNPPPRSPKSTEVVNKAMFQHQHGTSLNYANEACSLERKRILLQSKAPVQTTQSMLSSVEEIRRDLLNIRRKTCSNFPQVEDNTVERSKTPTLPHQNKLPQHFPPRSPDLSQRIPAAARKSKLSDSGSSKISSSLEPQAKRWEKFEFDSEKKFNSLEHRTMTSESSLTKWKFPIKKKYCYNCTCIGNLQECQCSITSKHGFTNDSDINAENKCESITVSCRSSPSPVDGPDKSKVSMTASILSPSESEAISKLMLENAASNTSFCYLSREDATENLDTAMEELENVYRSLRISNENLSMKENVDHDWEASTNNNHDINPRRVTDSSFCRDSSKPTTSADGNFSNKGSVDVTKKGKDTFGLSPTSGTTTPLMSDARTLSDALCIEELFGDLTEQLDLEQKLLQQTRKKPPNSPSQNRGNKFQKESVESCLSHIDQDGLLSITRDDPDLELREVKAISSIKHKILEKKKHKAVRSLSDNIASLMLNGGPVRPDREPDHLYRTVSPSLVRKSPSSKDEEVPADVTKKTSDSDEIWQVRVSMDPGKPPADPPLPSKATTTYLRLRSALRKPNENMSLKNAPEDFSQNPRQSGSQAAPDRTVTRLSENELEKLLTTLLGDVPDEETINDQISSPAPVNNEYESPNVTSKGEMLVLRHLDVIRNQEPS